MRGSSRGAGWELRRWPNQPSPIAHKRDPTELRDIKTHPAILTSREPFLLGSTVSQHSASEAQDPAVVGIYKGNANQIIVTNLVL